MIRVRRALTGAVVMAGLVLGLAGPAAAIEPPSGSSSNRLLFCDGDLVPGLATPGCTAPPKPASEYPTAQAARNDADAIGKTAKCAGPPVPG